MRRTSLAAALLTGVFVAACGGEARLPVTPSATAPSAFGSSLTTASLAAEIIPIYQSLKPLQDLRSSA